MINIDVIEEVIRKIHTDIEVKNITVKENGYILELEYDCRYSNKKISYQDYVNDRPFRQEQDSITRRLYMQELKSYRNSRINAITK